MMMRHTLTTCLYLLLAVSATAAEPYVDLITEYNTENPGSALVGDHFIDITPAFDWMQTNWVKYRKPIWLETPAVGQTPANAEDLCWLITDTISTPGTNGGWKLFGGGGFPVTNDKTASTLLNENFCRSCVIARNDTDAGGADLTWPFLQLNGVGHEVHGLYFRGAYDSADPSPEVCIEMDKAASIGTGKGVISDCAFDGFSTVAIDFGPDSSGNCDETWVHKCWFKNNGRSIRLSHDQVQQVIVGPQLLSEDPIVVDMQRGGPVYFRDFTCTTPSQKIINFKNGGKNVSLVSIENLKFDTQADGAYAIYCETAADPDGAWGRFIVRNMLDSDAIGGAIHTRFRLDGKYILLIDGAHGIGDIVVNGTTQVGGASDGALIAPYVIFRDCWFQTEAKAKNPRLCLKKTNGSQAVEGVDYCGCSWSGCLYYEGIGSSAIAGEETIQPKSGYERTYNEIMRALQTGRGRR